MRKLIPTLGATIAIMLAGCVKQYNTSSASTEQTKPITMLGRMVDSLVSAQPNALNNDVTKQVFADSALSLISRYEGGEMPFLAELPMEYEMCMVYPSYLDYAGQYVVKFSFADDSEKARYTFQVFTRMSKEDVMGLVDHEKYHIKGKFMYIPDNTSAKWFDLPTGGMIFEYPSVYKSSDDSPNVNLGSWFVDSVKYTKASS